MTEEQKYSWVFMSISLASQSKPCDLKGIAMVADGINHTVPTQEELQSSISWLLKNELIDKQGKKYKLTPKGKSEYYNVCEQNKALHNIWKTLEEKIKNYA